MLSVQSLIQYPVKSARGVAVTSAQVGPYGLTGDRRYIIVSDQGRMLTGREIPATVLIETGYESNALVLGCPGFGSVTLEKPTNRLVDAVKIWGDTVSGYDMGEAAAKWLTAVLGRPCRLLQIARRQNRKPVTPQSFVDAAPLLLVTQASVDDVNSRLAHPVSAACFRPNIIIDGPMPAFAEDTWARIRIGELVIDVLWGCQRCVFITVDPETGTKNTQMEPYETLSTYRTFSDKGVYFGQNVVSRSKGRLCVGDRVEILDVRENLITEKAMKMALNL